MGATSSIRSSVASKTAKKSCAKVEPGELRGFSLRSGIEKYAEESQDREAGTCILSYHSLIADLTNAHGALMYPVKQTASTFVRQATLAAKRDFIASGMFICTSLLDFSRPKHEFALVVAESGEQSKSPSPDTREAFIIHGQTVSNAVLKSKKPESLHATLGDKKVVFWAFPVFTYLENELRVEFNDVGGSMLPEELSSEGGKQENQHRASNPSTNIKRMSVTKDGGLPGEANHVSGGLAALKENELYHTKTVFSSGPRVGAAFVICFPAQGPNDVILDMETVNVIRELVYEAGGFLKQSIETEARQQHLYYSQRSLAAAMDTNYMFKNTEDLLKAIEAYQSYITSVLPVQDCLLFLFDEAEYQLWHRKSDGTCVREGVSDRTVIGRVALEQDPQIVYLPGGGEVVTVRLGEGDSLSDLGFSKSRNIELFGEFQSVLCVPLLSDMKLYGVVALVNKSKPMDVEWGKDSVRIANKSKLKSSQVAVAGSLLFVDRMYGKDGISQSPMQLREDAIAYFNDFEVQLVQSTAVELGAALEHRQLDITYILSNNANPADDLVSLLASYDSEDRQGGRKKRLSNSRTKKFPSSEVTDQQPLAPSVKVPEIQGAQLEKMDAQLASWDFDVLAEAEDDLILLAMRLFDQFELPSRYHLQRDAIHSFITEMKTGYLPNPYHNFHHAFSVLQATTLMLRGGMQELLKSYDVLALFIAALGHDVGHPGTNNVFQINSESQLALLYNDNSVLENFHASTTFRILQMEHCALLKNLKPEVKVAVREMIVKAILATDISHHFKLVSNLKAKYHEGMQRITLHGARSSSGGRSFQNTGSNEVHSPGHMKTERSASLRGVASASVATARLRKVSVVSQTLDSSGNNRSGDKLSPLGSTSEDGESHHVPHSKGRKKTIARRQGSTEVSSLHHPKELAASIFDIEEKADRTMLIEALLHTADLNNPVLEFDIYRKWTTLVVQEFYDQYLEEERLKLPTQPHMANPPDDEKAVANLQLHFIDFVVAPLWAIMRDIFPAFEDRYDILEDNRSTWKSILASDE